MLIYDETIFDEDMLVICPFVDEINVETRFDIVEFVLLIFVEVRFVFTIFVLVSFVYNKLVVEINEHTKLLMVPLVINPLVKVPAPAVISFIFVIEKLPFVIILK